MAVRRHRRSHAALRVVGMSMLLLAAPPAGAHLPHDQVVAFAAPSALDASEPWFVVADPSSAQQLLRSDDGGYSWVFVGGAPLVDDLSDAAQLDDGWTALMGEGRLWWTPDGESWEIQSVPSGFRQVEARGDSLLIAGRDGIAVLQRGEEPILELDVVVRQLSGAAGDPVAVDDQGRVWRYEAEVWEELLRPASGTISAAAHGSTVYAGTRGGEVWRHDGSDWQACGALPSTSGQPDVTLLAASSGVVLAAPADSAPWASFDGCDSWEDRHGATVSYGGSGGVSDADDAWSVLLAGDQTWLVGGWAGLSRSDDAGQHWDEAALVPPDYSRGAAFSPTFAQDHRVWVGGYTGGILRSLDAGATWSGPNLGMGAPNVQDVRVHPDDASRLFAIAGHTAWRSTDTGLHWSAVDAPLVYVGGFLPGPTGLWIQGRSDDEQSQLLYQPWASTAWQAMPASPGTGSLGLVVDNGVDLACMSVRSEGLLTCIEQDGADWRTRYEGAPGPMTAVQQLAAGGLLLGHGDLVLAATGDADDWQVDLSLGDDVVAELVATSDGGAVLGTATGRVVVRAPDGAWTDLDIRLSSMPNRITPRPDFDLHPQLLVSTCAGVFLVDLDTREVLPFASVQWVDDGTFEACDSCTVAAETSASFSTMRRLGEGETIVTKVRGERVAVRGRLDPGEEIRLSVFDPTGELEGSAVGTDADVFVGELVAVEDLGGGWHRVEVSGTAGSEVDVVVGESDGFALPVQPWTEGAGCRSLPAPDPLLGVLVALAAALRRRRGRSGAAGRVTTGQREAARAVP